MENLDKEHGLKKVQR